MANDDTWIDTILADAVTALANEQHAFEDAALAEFKALLAGELQGTLKPSDFKTMAATLGKANRPTS